MLLPKSVTAAPPPRLPPTAVVTTGSSKLELSASTSCQARRYDISISRAAAEIDPVASISVMSRALPGPIAGKSPASMRRVSPG